MKRQSCIVLASIAVLVLLISGCGQQTEPAEPITTTEKVTEIAEPTEDISEETRTDTEPEQGPEEGPSEAGQEPEDKAGIEMVTTTVSQEELDKLKEDLEEIQIEDLGGLSEE